MTLIGNDIVDLTQSRKQNKINNQPFSDRVFTSDEQEMIRRSSNPFLTLWFFWAAKETAYKICKKKDEKTVFAHKEFRVVPDEWVSLGVEGEKNGQLRYAKMNIDLRWFWNGEYVHCIGMLGHGVRKLHNIQFAVQDMRSFLPRLTLTKAEQNSVYSESSEKVRILAKELLEASGFVDIEILRENKKNDRGPPQLFLNRKLFEKIEISLSHDGNYLAAAMCLA